MSAKECCKTCANLHVCLTVDIEKLKQEYRCQAYEPATAEEVEANESIEKDFGAWALSFDVLPLQQKRATKTPAHKSRRRHRNG